MAAAENGVSDMDVSASATGSIAGGVATTEVEHDSLAKVILGEATSDGGGQGEVRDPVYTTWVDDPAEVSMRVWAFWRQWLIDGAGQLTYWNVALRLVVLVQPSSASAERVFTQLKLILETCGDAMLAQTVRVRLSHRCNGHDLRKIYVGSVD